MSPFQLLHGYPVRGPMHVLKEVWAAPFHNSSVVSSYVLKMNDKLDLFPAQIEELIQDALKTFPEGQEGLLTAACGLLAK